MHLAITIALALTLGFALLKLFSHHQAVRTLQQALFKRQTLLRDELPDAAGARWDQVRVATNELIAELGHLQQLRTGQLAQLEATLGSLQEAVLIVDANNYVLLANQALQAIFPRATHIIGQRLELVLHSAAFLNYVEAVRRGKMQPQHEVEFNEDNRTSWLEVTGNTIQVPAGQKGPWMLFVLHDITKQKNLEAVRKDFVANVSHELRTPLSVIKGYVETLVDDGQDEIPPADRARFLKIIQRHTERLNSLLEDLLVLSRLESINPGLHRESVNLQTLLTGILDDYHGRPAAAHHALDLTVGREIGPLLIDPLKLTQVVENLLDNALKYTPKNSRIQLDARLQGLGEIIVSIRDNGPGIPADDLPHLFERFYRVDKGRSREKGGTGLGLSIVKHIVQLHGGRVWAESKAGQGTVFYFSLPLRTNSPAERTV